MESGQQIDLSAGLVPKGNSSNAGSIDLSAGMVPKNGGAGAIDLSAGFVPKVTPTTIPAGHVAMTDQSNTLQAVPREQAQQRLNAGWKIGPPEQTHYTTPQEQARGQIALPQPTQNEQDRSDYLHSIYPPESFAGRTENNMLPLDVLGNVRNAMIQKGGNIGANVAEHLLIPKDNPNDPQTRALREKSPPIFTPPPHPISFDTPATRGIARGGGRVAGSVLADPLTYATAGAGSMGTVGKTVAGAGFSYLAGKGAVDAAGQLGEIWDREDIPEQDKYELATQAALSAIMSGAAGAHGVTEPFSADSPLLSKVPDAYRLTLAERINQAQFPDVMPPKLVKAVQAAFTRTAAQKLGSVVMPSDVGAFQTAASAVMPDVQRAAGRLGKTISNETDALAAITEAQRWIGKSDPAKTAALQQLAADIKTAPGRVASQPTSRFVSKGRAASDSFKQERMDDFRSGIADAFSSLPAVPESAPNPRFQLSSGSTANLPRAAARPQAQRPAAAQPATSTAFPANVTPQLPAKQFPLEPNVPAQSLAGTVTAASEPRSLSDIIAQRFPQPEPTAPQSVDAGPSNFTPTPVQNPLFRGRSESVPETAHVSASEAPQTGGAGEFAVERGQHPEEIIAGKLRNTPLLKVRATARELGIDVSAADNHAELVPKIVDKLFELDAQHSGLLDSFAEHLSGQRGEILPKNEPAPIQDTDLTDVMARSVEAVNAKKAAQPQGNLARIMRGGEKRSNLDYRSQVEGMNAEDKARAIYESPLTGLPNRRAFDDFSKAGLAETHPHVGYADVDSFKAVNTALGHEGADAVLKEIGTLFNEAQAEENGAVHSFHRSGDEFLFRASEPEAIDRVVGRVNDALAKTKFTFIKPDGTEIEQAGVGLSYGTGRTLESAEASAEPNKQLRKRQPGATQVRTVGTPASAGAAPEVNNVPERQSVPPVESGNAATSKTAQGFLTGGVSDDSFSEALRRQREEQSGGFGGMSISLSAPGTSPDNPISPHQLKPGQGAYVKVDELIPQPKKYQYKGNTDAAGVVAGQITGTRYNHDLANALSYYVDPETGEASPVNGHNRRNLAARSGEVGVFARRLDAPDVATARKIGALQNISEGRGTALDAANFFREENITPEDLRQRGIAISEGTAQQGLALSKLDPLLFEKVRSGKWTESRGATIGAATGDAAEQEAIAKLIQKAEDRGKDLTNGQVESIARQVVKHSGTVEEQGQDLFGSFVHTHSTALERAELDDFLQRQIAGDKRVFGSVASEGKARALGQVEGQQIKAGENAKISQRAAQELELYRKLSDKSGEVNDLLENGAKELANGYEKAATVKNKYAAKIRESVRKFIPPESEGNNPAGSKGAPRP